MICDDALSNSIDSRKFAHEFIARRVADLAGVPYRGVSSTAGADSGWNTVKGAKAGSNAQPTPKQPKQEGSGGFEVVGKKGKKAKK